MQPVRPFLQLVPEDEDGRAGLRYQRSGENLTTSILREDGALLPGLGKGGAGVL